MEARAQEEAARMAAPAADLPRAVDEATEIASAAKESGS